jgi:alkylation response protein AidB-like acyl-CoA dehydrogenase
VAGRRRAWPKEHGGTGWNATQRYIFSRECTAADAPRIFTMGIRMVGPVIMKFGTPEQKAKYLPPILSGDIVFCQGYSEAGLGLGPRQPQDPGRCKRVTTT